MVCVGLPGGERGARGGPAQLPRGLRQVRGSPGGHPYTSGEGLQENVKISGESGGDKRLFCAHIKYYII